MKNQLISLIALALLTLVACKQPVVVDESESPDYAAFDTKVKALNALYQAHCDEDFTALEAMISDTLKWSPAHYNGNKWLGKEDYLKSLKSYHDGFDNIKYTAGIITPNDSIANGVWSGSVFPKDNASDKPNLIRAYGTWTATHIDSGKEVGVKWFSLAGVNKDGKLVSASDYFDVNGLAVQIAAEE